MPSASRPFAKLCKSGSEPRVAPELDCGASVNRYRELFPLHSLPVRRIEIPQHSSSSLPPSFAAGRCATSSMHLRGGASARLAPRQPA